MPERTRIDVINVGTEREPVFRAEWDGQVVEAGNPFGLDSKLAGIGAPARRDLYLVEQEADR